MTHAIATAAVASGYLDSKMHNGNGPTADRTAMPSLGAGYWRNPVLTVANLNGRSGPQEVSFLFHNERGLVVSPWSHPVYVEGEDLFALRELLAELPEEAFKRPADPVADPVFVKTKSGSWFVECDDGTFRLAGTSQHEFAYWSERARGGHGSSLESLFIPEWGGIDDGTDAWVDGDQVLFPGRGWTLVRTRTNGEWVATYSSDPDYTVPDIYAFTDAQIDRPSNGYVALRRGGKVVPRG